MKCIQWAPSIKNAEDSSSESRSAESSEITRNNRTALNLSPSKPARSLQKIYGDAFENDFRARLGVLKIHSRFIARPLNRFTRVESIQRGFQVLSNGHESIQRIRFNGFKFNRRRPVVTVKTVVNFNDANLFRTTRNKIRCRQFAMRSRTIYQKKKSER